jgi:hypothetical protein
LAGRQGIPYPEDELVSASPFLLVTDVAERYRSSTRSILEKTRLRQIPHRKLPGSRRCLFLEEELTAWENGAELEVTELDDGGRVVRPKENGRDR